MVWFSPIIKQLIKDFLEKRRAKEDDRLYLRLREIHEREREYERERQREYDRLPKARRKWPQ